MRAIIIKIAKIRPNLIYVIFAREGMTPSLKKAFLLAVVALSSSSQNVEGKKGD